MSIKPDLEPWQVEMIASGTAEQCPACGLVVQRTKDGTLADGMKSHRSVVHLLDPR